MDDERTQDLPGGANTDPTESRDRWGLSELAEMLDAPIEKVRKWLSDEGIEPVEPNRPEDYGFDAIEYVRIKRHSI